MKYCPHCGSEIDTDTQFCPNCGSDLRERRGSSPQEPRQQTFTQPTLSTESARGPITEPGLSAQAAIAVYGDFFPRLIAWVIDIIIIGIISSIINFSLGLSFVMSLRVWMLTTLIGWIIGFLYFWGLETLNKGQTIGKALFKLRTVDKDTLKPVEAKEYALNNILKGFSVLIDVLVGLLLFGTSDKKKRFRLGQKMSDTVVIKE